MTDEKQELPYTYACADCDYRAFASHSCNGMLCPNCKSYRLVEFLPREDMVPV